MRKTSGPCTAGGTGLNYWIVALDDRYDKWFRSYSATVLEDTRGDDVEGYQSVMGHDGNFLMIVDGEIRIFDAATGMDAGRIVPQDGGRYVSMDMDTLSGMLYALDSVHSRIDCVSSSGGLTGSVQLEGGPVLCSWKGGTSTKGLCL